MTWRARTRTRWSCWCWVSGDCQPGSGLGRPAAASSPPWSLCTRVCQRAAQTVRPCLPGQGLCFFHLVSRKPGPLLAFPEWFFCFFSCVLFLFLPFAPLTPSPWLLSALSSAYPFICQLLKKMPEAFDAGQRPGRARNPLVSQGLRGETSGTSSHVSAPGRTITGRMTQN